MNKTFMRIFDFMADIHGARIAAIAFICLFIAAGWAKRYYEDYENKERVRLEISVSDFRKYRNINNYRSHKTSSVSRCNKECEACSDEHPTPIRNANQTATEWFDKYVAANTKWEACINNSTATP